MNNLNKFTAIKECIESNYASYDFTISVLCEAQGVSRVTLHRIIKKHSGQTTSDYLNNVRLREAYSILLHQELPIKEVASKVGYSNPKYFSRIFKKRFGVSPTQIRVK